MRCVELEAATKVASETYMSRGLVSFHEYDLEKELSTLYGQIKVLQGVLFEREDVRLRTFVKQSNKMAACLQLLRQLCYRYRNPNI